MGNRRQVERMTSPDYLKPELGRISRFVDVPELLVRVVGSYGLTEELDGSVHEDDSGDFCPTSEERLQGRLVNVTKHRLSDIKYDLSYYDASGKFLGLSKSRFLEEDELEVDDHFPIDMKAEMPEDTAKCVFNVRAKKPGIIGRLFWG